MPSGTSNSFTGLSLDYSERAIIVDFTVDRYTFNGKSSSRTSEPQRKRIRLNPLGGNANVPALASAIVAQCDLIPPSKTALVAELLYELQHLEAAQQQQQHGGVPAGGNSTSAGVASAAAALLLGADADADEVQPAYPDRLDDYLELLYEDSSEARLRGAGSILALARRPVCHPLLLSHEPLMSALGRILRDDGEWKRGGELARRLMGIFLCFSTFLALHDTLIRARLGDTAMRSFAMESRRAGARNRELGHLGALAAFQATGDAAGEARFRAEDAATQARAAAVAAVPAVAQRGGRRGGEEGEEEEAEGAALAPGAKDELGGAWDGDTPSTAGPGGPPAAPLPPGPVDWPRELARAEAASARSEAYTLRCVTLLLHLAEGSVEVEAKIAGRGVMPLLLAALERARPRRVGPALGVVVVDFLRRLALLQRCREELLQHGAAGVILESLVCSGGGGGGGGAAQAGTAAPSPARGAAGVGRAGQQLSSSTSPQSAPTAGAAAEEEPLRVQFREGLLSLSCNLCCDAAVAQAFVSGGAIHRVAQMLKTPAYRAGALRLLYQLSRDSDARAGFCATESPAAASGAGDARSSDATAGVGGGGRAALPPAPSGSETIPLIVRLVTHFPGPCLPPELGALVVNICAHPASGAALLGAVGVSGLVTRLLRTRDPLVAKALRALSRVSFAEQARGEVRAVAKAEKALLRTLRLEEARKQGAQPGSPGSGPSVFPAAGDSGGATIGGQNPPSSAASITSSGGEEEEGEGGSTGGATATAGGGGGTAATIAAALAEGAAPVRRLLSPGVTSAAIAEDAARAHDALLLRNNAGRLRRPAVPVRYRQAGVWADAAGQLVDLAVEVANQLQQALGRSLGEKELAEHHHALAELEVELVGLLANLTQRDVRPDEPWGVLAFSHAQQMQGQQQGLFTTLADALLGRWLASSSPEPPHHSDSGGEPLQGGFLISPLGPALALEAFQLLAALALDEAAVAALVATAAERQEREGDPEAGGSTGCELGDVIGGCISLGVMAPTGPFEADVALQACTAVLRLLQWPVCVPALCRGRLPLAVLSVLREATQEACGAAEEGDEAASLPLPPPGSSGTLGAFGGQAQVVAEAAAVVDTLCDHCTLLSLGSEAAVSAATVAHQDASSAAAAAAGGEDGDADDDEGSLRHRAIEAVEHAEAVLQESAALAQVDAALLAHLRDERFALFNYQWVRAHEADMQQQALQRDWQRQQQQGQQQRGAALQPNGLFAAASRGSTTGRTTQYPLGDTQGDSDAGAYDDTGELDHGASSSWRLESRGPSGFPAGGGGVGVVHQQRPSAPYKGAPTASAEELFGSFSAQMHSPHSSGAAAHAAAAAAGAPMQRPSSSRGQSGPRTPQGQGQGPQGQIQGLRSPQQVPGTHGGGPQFQQNGAPYGAGYHEDITAAAVAAVAAAGSEGAEGVEEEDPGNLRRTFDSADASYLQPAASQQPQQQWGERPSTPSATGRPSTSSGRRGPARGSAAL